MKKYIMFSIGFALCILLVSACGGAKNPLVGHWALSSTTHITGSSPFKYFYFYDDGTYSSGGSNYKGTYSTSGKNLRLGGFLIDDANVTYEIKDNQLIIEYWGGTEIYSKVDE